jgi:hypothetical protein
LVELCHPVKALQALSACGEILLGDLPRLLPRLCQLDVAAGLHHVVELRVGGGEGMERDLLLVVLFLEDL